MISATRQWFRRNRTNFAIGIGVLGAGYVAGQYLLNRINEARDRLGSERVSKENLRRRFEQNQEDCTFTVLALLPTATEDILEALPVENITHQLQQKRVERAGGRSGVSENTHSEPSSESPSVTGDDGKSLSSFQSESYVHASQTTASNSGDGAAAGRLAKKTKAELWNDLKISSITRTYTLLYTLSLLTLLTRIQLNLLGRRNYLSSVVSLTSHPPNEPTISLENRDDDNVEQAYGNDFETNRKFLTFSWWLLHRGWRDIMIKIEVAVKEVFGPINPREDITMEMLSSLTLEVRKKIEGNTEEERRARRWLPHLLPPPDQEEFVLNESGMSPSPPNTANLTEGAPPAEQIKPASPTIVPFRRLLDETSDLIDSPTFTHIHTLLLDILFSHLTDSKLRAQAFKLPVPDSQALPEDTSLRIQEIFAGQEYLASQPLEPPQAKAKLATILAVMTRQAHSIGNGVPNDYVQAMESVRELDAFAAVVYSSNFEYEVPLTEVDNGGGKLPLRGNLLEEAEGVGDPKTKDVGAHSGRSDGLFENVWGKMIGTGTEPITG